MKENWLEKSNEARDKVYDCISELSETAHAFGMTGNITMQRFLISICDDLDRAMNQIQDAISQNIQNEYESARESVYGTLAKLVDTCK